MRSKIIIMLAVLMALPVTSAANECVDAKNRTVINATPILKLARQTLEGQSVPAGEKAVADSFYRFGKIQLRNDDGVVAFEGQANIRLTLERQGLYGYKCELQIPDLKNVFLQPKSYDCVYRIDNSCDYVKTDKSEALLCPGFDNEYSQNIVVGILTEGPQGIEGLLGDAKVAAGITTSESLVSLVKRQVCSSDNDSSLCYPYNGYTMYSDRALGYIGGGSDKHGNWIYWDTQDTALHAKQAKYCTTHPSVTTGGFFARVLEKVLGLEFGSL